MLGRWNTTIQTQSLTYTWVSRNKCVWKLCVCMWGAVFGLYPDNCVCSILECFYIPEWRKWEEWETSSLKKAFLGYTNSSQTMTLLSPLSSAGKLLRTFGNRENHYSNLIFHIKQTCLSMLIVPITTISSNTALDVLFSHRKITLPPTKNTSTR